MEQIGHQKEAPIDGSLLRHMILNTLRSNVMKYKNHFHPVVLACDSREYWRKDIFPYYKANRKKTRDESPIDWKFVFDFFSQVKGEIQEYLPYRLIEVEGAEGDDVIGTLCRHLSQPTLIISSDHDFIQLQDKGNIKQWDPIRKKEVTTDDPVLFLKNHIIEGDRGDGIPNVLSDDDTFVIPGKRQIALTKKRRDLLLEDDFGIGDRLKRNFKRNEKMINLTNTPDKIKDAIIDRFDKQSNKTNNMHEYFIKFQMRNLYTSIGDFT